MRNVCSALHADHQSEKPGEAGELQNTDRLRKVSHLTKSQGNVGPRKLH